ncbi:MAG: tRNA pseudouridine(55) synthase TruB [Candidatus Altiarchaeales archaeon WOR_SM1_86-2]|nr:MAG: tRNA pseudouridine(55) synthase TruB [Candidatus Altiarchaeales archaeon WOR_SM1_86-2]
MEFDITREVIVKSESGTDLDFGCDPEKRPIEKYIDFGMVNLDKPSGPTSHQISAWVRGILHVNKTGHSGTLDPKVTGVLPIALENSTKALTALNVGKEYVGVMHLHGEVSKGRVKKVCKYFRGEIYQRPPLKSSVKRQLRIRKIHYIKFMEMLERDVLFKVGCEAGTYVRKLCHDMGLVLGTGAHMAQLRRTKVGGVLEEKFTPFDESNLVRLQDLKDAYEFYIEDGDESYLRGCVMPVEKGIQHLKKIWVKDSAVNSICYGADLNAPGVCKFEAGIETEEQVGLFTLKNELVATGKSLRNSKEIARLSRGIVVDTGRVIMERDVYPKRWGV